MKISKTDFQGLVVIQPKVLHDDRGYFFEYFRDDLLKEKGINVDFVQGNQSRSSRGILSS